MKSNRSGDKTAAARQRAAIARLKQAGGERICIKLMQEHIAMLGSLIDSGFSEDKQSAIRKAIEIAYARRK
jgi:hypothetical protein